MSRIFLTAVLLLGLSITAIGQEKSKIATTKGATELTKSKESGNYSFTLPKEVTAITVEQNAKSYVMYFRLDFNETTHEALIKMITNDEKSRHVICRFMISSGIEQISVDGKEMIIEDFFTTFLK